MNEPTATPKIANEAWATYFMQTHELILAELREIQADPNSAPARYPKAALAVEFFRLLRGEAFHTQRPPLVRLPNNKTPYQLEDILTAELEKVRALVDFSTERAQYRLKEMGKLFAVPSSAREG